MADTLVVVELDTISDVSMGSAKSNQDEFQQLFSEQVLARDENMCVFCCSNQQLQATHIYNKNDIKFENNIDDLLKGLKLFTVYDMHNGITLCYDCHQQFECHLCSTHVDSTNTINNVTIVVSNSLLLSENKIEREKWQQLNNQSIHVPNDCEIRDRTWPSLRVFKYREYIYDLQNSLRNETNDGKNI